MYNCRMYPYRKKGPSISKLGVGFHMNRIIITLLSVLLFSACGSPKSDGIKAAEAFRKCDESFMDNLLREFADFEKKFDEYRFSSRVEARRKVEEIIEKENQKYTGGIARAEQQYMKLKHKYVGNPEKMLQFEYAYRQQKDFDRQYVEHGLPSQALINEKILTIIPPKPTQDQMKLDLVGRTFRDKAGGYFESRNFTILNDEVQAITILSETEGRNIYRINADITLQERAGSATFVVNMDIVYVLKEADDWLVDGISANSIDIVRTGSYDKYLSATITHPLYGSLNLTNYSDMTLIVGGVILAGEQHKWLRFCVDVKGNSTYSIGGGIFSKFCTDVQEFEVHFVERR